MRVLGLPPGGRSLAECAVLGIADKLKGQLPIGLIVLKAGVDKDHETISKECIQMVRDKIVAQIL